MERRYITQPRANGHLAGDGVFTRRCSEWQGQQAGARKALPTHSCAATLEMAAILVDLLPCGELLVPSCTVVSTANAFVLRGTVPVSADIRPATLSSEETWVEAAIPPRNRASARVRNAHVPRMGGGI
jgi:dTDP-4-amino-4,6-dideoxygalactose transaminase